MKDTLISVIVPMYNVENYIERCLRSIFANSYRNLEVIVVNDGSTDNSENIVKNLKKEFPKIKLVNHKKNMGLFQARITGFETSKGEYISFVDSDDYVSVDWFRMLYQTAIENNSDITIGQFIFDNEKGEKGYDNLDPLRQPVLLEGKEVVETFMTQQGKYYSWQLVWNKLYSRKLWEKSLSDLKNFSLSCPKLVMCEDIAFSSALWNRAEKVSNFTTGAYYYYFKHSGASTNLNDNKERNEKYIKNVAQVFEFMKDQLKENKNENFIDFFTKWKLDYAKQYYINLKNYDKNFYLNLIEENFKFDKNQICEPLEKNVFYENNTGIDNAVLNWENELKEKITSEKYKVISFDIFDTLIVRPFAEPTDLFNLLNKKFFEVFNINSYYNFAKIRIDEERRAREFLHLNSNDEEITIDDIYNLIGDDYGFDKQKLEEVKLEEIKLEETFCYKRDFVKQLYDLAKQQNKIVIATSDMYLPLETVKSILNKNGYVFDKVYLSSDIKLTKHTGNLYKYIAKELNINPSQFLHFGDNYDTDVDNAQKCKWNSCHIAKTMDILKNWHPRIYGGDIFNSIKKYSFNQDFRDLTKYFIGFSAMMGLIANKLFSNPYVQYNKETDFNVCPYNIGYEALGPYLFAITDWLINKAKEQNSKTIHFIARDGFLPMQAFELFKKHQKFNLNSNYLYLSRKSMGLMDVYNKNDLYSLTYKMNSTSSSPSKIIKLFEPFFYDNYNKTNNKNVKKLLKPSEKNFYSHVMFEKYLNDIYNLVDEKKLESKRNAIRNYFLNIIKENDILFDIGYSGRQELALSKLLGYSVNSLYLHTNSDMCETRTKMGNFTNKCFYDKKPTITGVIREHVFMKLAPSNIDFDVSNNKVTPVFEDYKMDAVTEIVTRFLQKGALDFVNDYLKIFGEHLDFMFYRKDDFAFMFEYYLNFSKPKDRNIFGSLVFEDELGTGSSFYSLDFWNNEINTMGLNNQPQVIYQQVKGFPSQANNTNTAIQQKSRKRKIVDFFLPLGTKRRAFFKKMYYKFKHKK